MLRDVVLDRENIGQITVVAFGPEMSAAQSIDQLGCDANPVAGFANAAFQGEPDTEFTAYVGNIERLALIGKGRVARDDEQCGHFG